MKKLVLVGAGGHCKVMIEAIDRAEYVIAGILDGFAELGTEVCGIPVIGSDEEAEGLLKKGITHAAISLVGNLKLRRELLYKYKKLGFQFPRIIHSAASVSGSAQLGEGAVILAGARVNAEAVIGDYATVNTGAVVEHEVNIGENSHVAPGSILLGGVSVGKDTLVGAGSIVLQMTQIGDGCTIGAGSVVTRSLKAGSTAFGNPARLKE